MVVFIFGYMQVSANSIGRATSVQVKDLSLEIRIWSLKNGLVFKAARRA